jgi:hypothetical protein
MRAKKKNITKNYGYFLTSLILLNNWDILKN